MYIDVILSPAEIASVLPTRDLSGTTCVVFDVLRATSSMVTALARRVPRAVSGYMLLTGEPISGEEALRAGLVSKGRSLNDYLVESFTRHFI